MTSDFGVTAGHVEYSNRRFDFDTRHRVMIEVYRHTAALPCSGLVVLQYLPTVDFLLAEL